MSQRTPSRLLLPAAALLLLAAGFCLGRQSSRPRLQSLSLPDQSSQETIHTGIEPRLANTEPVPPPKGADVASASRTPAGEIALCNTLRELASSDPKQALALASSASTPRQRELFRNAALHGWATREPMKAASWILSQVRAEERRTACESLAAGAVVNAAAAMEAFNHLIAADPLLASDHGNALVTAFAREGQFTAGLRFAWTTQSPYRAAWLSSVFHPWAAYDPHAALAALAQIPDQDIREEARAGLFAGWSNSDPQALVVHAQTLPLGDARLSALRDGLAQWVFRDPAAASAWMDRFDPSPDLDSGAAAIAVTPALIARKPDVAASWAESITDPELRAHTLLDLIRLWSLHDPEGARRYAATSAALRPETRELALASLEPGP